MKVNKSRRVRITEDFSFTIFGKELLEMINQELAAQGEGRIPDDADLYIQVPGGGDWSNTALDLSEHPLHIEWTTETQE